MEEKQVCFDTETTSLNALEAELVGIAFSWIPGQGYYLAIPESREEALEIIALFKPFLRILQLKKLDIT